METTTIKVRQTTDTIATATARQHTVLVDRPMLGGGTDEGPKARELFLMSLGGCFMNNLKAAIIANRANITDLQLDVIGTVDGPPRRFIAIEMVIRATYDDADLMQKIITIAERGCLISNTIRETVELTMTLADA